MGVADFYSSYVVANGTGYLHIPYTCAQETCAGYNTHDAHQDISYANMVYSKLLQYTNLDAKNNHNVSVSNTTRQHWQHMLDHLAP